MQDHEYVVEDTELDKMLAVVATEAYPYVIDAHKAFVAENGEDYDDEGLYLYVYTSGEWLIDSPSYLQDHRNIVAYAGIYDYVNADTLRYALEESSF